MQTLLEIHVLYGYQQWTSETAQHDVLIRNLASYYDDFSFFKMMKKILGFSENGTHHIKEKELCKFVKVCIYWDTVQTTTGV